MAIAANNRCAIMSANSHRRPQSTIFASTYIDVVGLCKSITIVVDSRLC